MKLQFECLNMAEELFKNISFMSYAITKDSKNPLILIYDKSFSIIMQCDVDNNILKITSVTNIAETIPTKFIFAAADKLYKITGDGRLSQLVYASSNGSSGEIFGLNPSDSKGSESYSWMEVNKIPSCILIVGLHNQRCSVIHKIDDTASSGYCLQLIDLLHGARSIYYTWIGYRMDPSQNWYMRHFSSSDVSVSFLRALLPDFIIVSPDFLLIASTSGTISILPIMQEAVSSVKPKCIHFDYGQVISIEVSPCGNALLVIYKSGKVVVIDHCELSSKLKYSSHYLSKEVSSVIIYRLSDCQFSILWSDGNSLSYTLPLTRKTFSLHEHTASLRGIAHLLVINTVLLAIDFNRIFYIISMDNKESGSPTLMNGVHLNDITCIGKDIEETQQKISNLNNHIQAFVDEQIDPSDIILKYDDSSCELSVENLSTRTFSKNCWSVMLQSRVEAKCYVKYFPLDHDFGPKQSISLPLDYFTVAACRSLKVSFVGCLLHNQRQLTCPLGCVQINNRDNSLSGLRNDEFWKAFQI